MIMHHDLAKFNVPNSGMVHCYRSQKAKENCNGRHFLQQCLHQNFNIFWTNVHHASILLPGAAVAVTSEVRASAVLLLIVGSYTV
jgi:hypothetical protein